MRHDSITTFARSVVGAAVLFGTLLAPEAVEDRRRREARAAMFHQGPTFWRGWPGLSPTNYGTERGERVAPSVPVEGGCPLWLAVFLGSAGLAFTLIALGHEAWMVFR